jgi:hypothetical protein
METSRSHRHAEGEAAGRKLCPKIILEGTRLPLKTEIAFALNEHPRVVGPRAYPYTSPIISAEWCGFTNTPWGRGLINFLPEERGLAEETYRTWVHLFELLRYDSWIVDRFHLSTQLYQKLVNHLNLDFGWLEGRLRLLGFRLVFCVRSPETFEAARAQRLRVSAKPSQYDDPSRFVEEQEVMRELVAASSIPSPEVDVSDSNVGAAADTIADWLAKSGGLWLSGSSVAMDAEGG